MQKLRGVEYGVGPAHSSQAVMDSQKYRNKCRFLGPTQKFWLGPK